MGAKKNSQETEDNIGKLERNKGDNWNHGSVLTVDIAVLMHVMNLEGLAADSARRNVVIIAS